MKARVEMHSFAIDIQSIVNLNLFMTFTYEGPLHFVIKLTISIFRFLNQYLTLIFFIS